MDTLELEGDPATARPDPHAAMETKAIPASNPSLRMAFMVLRGTR